MKAFRLTPLRFFDGLIDRIVVIAGALLMGQFPQFYGQYLQRLGGHLAEARYQLTQYTQAAELQHLTIQEYIQVHLQSGNKVFMATGKIISALFDRMNFLETSYHNFRNASPLFRPWVFLSNLDFKIAWETWSDYTPGIPITGEGVFYSLIGLLLAWGAYCLIKNVLRYVFGKSLPKNKPAIGV